MEKPVAKQRAAGCLFGLALGDALGAETEFLSVSDILHRFPPDGPRAPEGHPARVTDDTQMTLAVGEALLEAARPYSARTLEQPLRRAFVAWASSPDNNRAPGITCMRACDNLARSMPWYEATVHSSKGSHRFHTLRNPPGFRMPSGSQRALSFCMISSVCGW